MAETYEYIIPSELTELLDINGAVIAPVVKQGVTYKVTLSTLKGDTGSTGATGATGDDGREVELQNNGSYLQWRYVGEVSWINMLALEDIKGDTGAAGADGADGKDIELQKSLTHVQWRYVGDVSWTDLIPLSEIEGNPGQDGVDGREVELQNDSTYIQWRYVGEVTWTNLVPLTAIKGDQGEKGDTGDNGRDIELQKSLTHVQWRYVGDASWTDLVLLSDLKGDKGDQGDQGVQGIQGVQGDQGIQGVQGNPGQDGVDHFVYVAYASDDSGTGFSLTPTNGLKYRAEIHVQTEIATPTTGDFSGASWVKYIGEDGAGAGDMTKSIYDPSNKSADAFSMDNMVEGTSTKILSDTERTKLAGIADGAEVNPDNSSIKTQYESNADTNAFTDAEKTLLANQSGTNTGDQDLSGLAEKTNVLEKDNTGAFTPSADYHPATKKYVDDNAGAGGDITGPASSTDHAIVRFDGTTGKTIQDSAVVINDDGQVGIGGSIDPEGADLTVYDNVSGGGAIKVLNTSGDLKLQFGDLAFNVLNGSYIRTYDTDTSGNKTFEVNSSNGDVDITGSYKINNTSINTAGTLSNVAYLNQANTFTGTVTTSGNYQLNDANTYIAEDVSSNMTFTDAVTGTKTLADLAAGGGASVAMEQTFTATAGQTNFTLTNAPGAAWVIKQGVLQAASTWSISGNDVVLTTAAADGDSVDIYYLSNVGSVGSFDYNDLTNKPDLPNNTPQTISYSATPSQDYDSGATAVITLTGDVTTYTLSNVPDGASAEIIAIQDATGGYGIAALEQSGLTTKYLDNLAPVAANINSGANAHTVISYKRVGSYLYVTYAKFGS